MGFVVAVKHISLGCAVFIISNAIVLFHHTLTYSSRSTGFSPLFDKAPCPSRDFWKISPIWLTSLLAKMGPSRPQALLLWILLFHLSSFEVRSICIRQVITFLWNCPCSRGNLDLNLLQSKVVVELLLLSTSLSLLLV